MYIDVLYWTLTFILGQVTAAQSNITEKTNKISSNIEKYEQQSEDLEINLRQVTTDQKKITNETNKISSNIEKYEQQLKDLQENQDTFKSKITKEQQIFSNIIYYENELTRIHNYTNLLWNYINSNGTYDDIEQIVVYMRDSIEELTRLIGNLKDGISSVGPEHINSLNSQMRFCLIRMLPLTNVNLHELIKTSAEEFIKKLNIIYNKYRQLKDNAVI